MRSPRVVAVLVAAVVAAATGLGVAGCGPGAETSANPAPVNLDQVAGAAGVRGVRLADPLAKPDTSLVDTDGQPYDVRTRTSGKLVLMFFGFTRCSDVCPTTMADLDAALDLTSPEVADQVVVVFVTADPDHDTPAVTRHWLDQFNSSFVGLTSVGLTSGHEVLSAYAADLGVELVPPRTNPDGTVVVGHGSQVTAFGPDGVAHVAYDAGTTVADYAHDIPLLIRGEL